MKLFSYNGVTDTLALDISGSQIGIGTLADPNYQLTAPSINANKLSKNRPAGWFGSNNNSSTNTFHTLSHNGDLFFTNGKFINYQ